MRFILSAFCLLLLSSPLVHAQQAGIPTPLVNFASAGGLVVTDTVTCYIDSTPHTRGATAADLELIHDKTFNTPWPKFLDGINRAPRSYAFWMQAGLRNNSDSTLELSMAYGQTDFVDAWAGSQYISGGWLRVTPPQATYLQRQSQTLPLRLAPHETVRLVVRLREFTDNYSFSGLQFYDPATLGAGALKTISTDNANLIVQMLFEGFLLCQLLYVLSQWLIIRRREYLYYLFYITLIWLYFLSKQEQLFGMDILFTRWPPLRSISERACSSYPIGSIFVLYEAFSKSPVTIRGSTVGSLRWSGSCWSMPCSTFFSWCSP